MSNVPGEPYSGPYTIDLNHLRGLLIDVAKGGISRLRREQPGISAVVEELNASYPKHGRAAGIPNEVYSRFLQYTDHITRIRLVRGTVEKLLEVLKESEATYEHERENTISQMADSVRSTAKRESNQGILAPFEKLLAYNSQIANKAAKTRRKNEAGSAEPTDDAG